MSYKQLVLVKPTSYQFTFSNKMGNVEVCLAPSLRKQYRLVKGQWLCFLLIGSFRGKCLTESEAQGSQTNPCVRDLKTSTPCHGHRNYKQVMFMLFQCSSG